MPDVVGTGVIKIEVDDSSTEADITKAVDKANASIGSKSKSTGDTAGKNFGDAYSKAIKTKLDAAVKALPTANDIKLGVNTDDATVSILAVRAELKDLSEQRIGIDISDADAMAKIAALKVQLATLKTSSNNQIRVDASQAESALLALDKDLDTTKKKAEDTAGKDKGQGFGLLLTSILALGPAVVPLAGVLVADLGAAALIAGSLALAVKGASAAMTAGTKAGQEYSAGIKTLGGDLDKLEQTAADAALPAFNQSINVAQGLMKQLNPEVAEFADVGGKDVVLALKGIADGFVTLHPLFSQLGVDSEHLFADFDKYASGGGLAKFEAWVQANLPTVDHSLEEVAQAVAHITAAIAPMGITSLSTLGLVAKAINALPIGTLQILLPLVVDTYLAFKAYEGLDSIATQVTKFATAIQGVGTKAASTGGATLGLSAANDAVAVSADGAAIAEKAAGLSLEAAIPVVGAIAVGVGLLASAFLGSSKSTQAAKQAVDDYTQAIEQDNGVIGANTNSVIANNLVKSGAITLAGQLHIGTADLTNAVLGNQSALDQVTTSLKAQITAGTSYSGSVKAQVPVYNDQAQAAQKLLGILQDTGSELNTSAKQASQYTAANKAISASLNSASEGAKTFADQQTDVQQAFGLSANVANSYATIAGYVDKSYLSNSQNAHNYATAVGDMIGQLSLAGPAANNLAGAMSTYAQSAGTAADRTQLLGAYLIDSQGDALSFAGAMSNSYAAVQNLITGFKGAEKASVDLKTGTIDYTKAGAGPLVQALQSVQTQAQTAAEALYNNQLGSEGAGKAAQDAGQLFYNMTNGALVDNYKQLGLNKDQAKALANQYFKIPKDWSTTVHQIGLGDINTTLNALGIELAKLTGLPWVVAVNAADGATPVVNKIKEELVKLNGSTAYVQVSGIVNGVAVGGRQIIIQKDGGTVDYYASGGMRENHTAQIAPAGANRVFAEPETGGEAYIPLSPAKRVRSTAIWKETGKRLQAFSDGGFSGDVAGGLEQTALISVLLQAVETIARRPVHLEADGVQLARVVNRGSMVLGRIS